MLTPCIAYRLRRSRVSSSPTIRLGVDIGGTFTDVALELGERRFTARTLTTTAMPEKGVLTALGSITAEAGISPDQVGLIIHGTTLATNALIERKGARTALLTTEGFRDVVEIRHENRFEQYDVNIDLPPPLVPRRLRLAHPRAHRCARRGVGSFGRGQRASRDRDPCRTAGGGGGGRVPAQLHQSGARTCGRGCDRTGTAAPPADLVLRSRAGDARIRALLHRLRQCLHPAPDRTLPGATAKASWRAPAFAVPCC